ncbi:TetR/AcrR family transcriptional regulator [Saccharopolyspora rectivirgula]|uniref:TetR family transcriptional regulator n=1 Tax=Saccharopolyspora rectivirgula TaxID=28042 RepID=A0A073B211_9PSEU|nr:TetR/AcrR family transcriptional regulator [Saccharopolyspora rectivirgula]KEI45586.1 TetR family transcriptional regulator [Saccharopolyspora rectivirgula]
MPQSSATPSARKVELLEAAYRYALTHGLAGLSLRPLAKEIGSSPRVLLYLFGSKEGLVQALLTRARADELELLADLRAEPPESSADDRLVEVAERLWAWLAADEHRALLKLWLEGYARSLVEPEGVWAGFARATVADWLDVLATAQPERVRRSQEGLAQRTQVLALLRGALLDLLATGDVDRTTAAVRRQLRASR